MKSILSQLNLSAEDTAALRRQGFVSRECRCGRTYYRLRYRDLDGAQRTCYLGNDAVAAEQVQQELAQLQAARCADVELGKVAKQAGQKLRAGVKGLASQLEAAGYHCHGLAFRQKRVRQ